MKILIVDDSALLRSILKQVLQSHADIKELYEATNGKQAVEMNRNINPNLIIMDITMPIMDGFEATEIIMKEHPAPVLILSNDVDSAASYRALNLGALEVMKKPELDEFNNPAFFRDFIDKLKALASSDTPEKAPFPEAETPAVDGNSRFQMIVVGASTGGPKALSRLLKPLPKKFPLGIVIVQHLETGFDESFTQWLDGETALAVRIARNNDVAGPGEAVVAPAGKHLVFDKKYLLFDDSPKILNQKPSVDKLFMSAARQFESQLIGILLTGMGTDGAEGCVEIKARGGYTIAQDQTSSTIFGMPRAAIERKGATRVLPLDSIADFILRLTGQE
ncbi:MAG TPA: chemotaxis-specific protein-glutamate methyltransferase CheB [Spirochaetota bacterium]|nr:chemotaxis-specific protein-glutamate methyltransferase CheB [Spirochaetota bacterium]